MDEKEHEARRLKINRVQVLQAEIEALEEELQEYKQELGFLLQTLEQP